MSRLLWLWILLIYVLLIPNAYSEVEDWVPSPRSYAAASQGRECAIYRSIVSKTRLTLQQSEDADLHFSELLKVRRGDLIHCAKAHQVEINGSPESEELAAETCRQAYQTWIETGYRFQANRQDNENAKRSLNLLTAALNRDCARPGEMVHTVLRIQ